MTEGGSLRKNGFHTDLERLHKFTPCAQVFAVCAETLDRPVEKADAMLRRLSQEIEENSDIVMLCLNFHDIKKAAESGKVAVFISIEGCEQISSLESAYQNGVRILHPTWNFDNELCGAAVGSGRGLTEKGRAFVKKAQHMGFALDMSHCIIFWIICTVFFPAKRCKILSFWSSCYLALFFNTILALFL